MARLGNGLRLKLAQLKRGRSEALHIGITGSSAKSTTTALLAHILEGQGSVHAQIYENTIPQLARTLCSAPLQADYIVAEVGATVKGSIMPMARLLRPDVAIITKVGLEHYSAFRGKDAVAREKGELVAALRPSGLAILNADDPHVMAMAKRTQARIVTFGRSENADYRLDAAEASFPQLLKVTVSCRKGSFELQTAFVGEEFWIATLGAFATAVELGVAPTLAASRIASFPAPWNRCGVLATSGGPTFIIDTVKAPNDSIPAAIAILRKSRAANKRAIIGFISDYTGGTRKGTALAYDLAYPCSDQFIFVGENGHRARPSEDDKKSGKFIDFLLPREASDYVRATSRPDELILLKGSQTQHLERIALSWTHDVRCWETNCGKYIDCLQCGMVEVPYNEHRQARKARARVWRSKGFSPSG
ncbi:hypothetical protein GCM10010836_22660 [Aminobacter aminovorans]